MDDLYKYVHTKRISLDYTTDFIPNVYSTTVSADSEGMANMHNQAAISQRRWL